jgi:hypothetical protein
MEIKHPKWEKNNKIRNLVIWQTILMGAVVEKILLTLHKALQLEMYVGIIIASSSALSNPSEICLLQLHFHYIFLRQQDH